MQLCVVYIIFLSFERKGITELCFLYGEDNCDIITAVPEISVTLCGHTKHKRKHQEPSICIMVHVRKAPAAI